MTRYEDALGHNQADAPRDTLSVILGHDVVRIRLQRTVARERRHGDAVADRDGSDFERRE